MPRSCAAADRSILSTTTGCLVSLTTEAHAITAKENIGSDEAAIRELVRREGERCRAISESDWAALGDLLHDDFTYGFLSGRVEDKATYLAGIPSRPHGHRRTDLTTRLYGGGTVGVMTGGFVSTTPQGEVANIGTALQVWVRDEDGDWKLAAINTTRTAALPTGLASDGATS
jgi:hypothetical protein